MAVLPTVLAQAALGAVGDDRLQVPGQRLHQRPRADRQAGRRAGLQGHRRHADHRHPGSARPRRGRPAAPPPAATPRPPEARVDPGAQRARDSDSRRILEGELRREEERLAELKREYNNGEPERLGNERNYQKYLDRVADLKSGIARKESDIAAIKRELAKLPP